MPGVQPAVTQAQSAGLPNRPFDIGPAFGTRLGTDTVTRDLYHRFFENQMQIDGGRNDGFVAWGDSGGLVMGHFDTGETAMTALAREYVLADHFFQGAFGGSFLNHQYLICACAPSTRTRTPRRPSPASPSWNATPRAATCRAWPCRPRARPRPWTGGPSSPTPAT
jgi:acid phosphatase